MIRKPSHRCHRRIRFWSGNAVFAKGCRSQQFIWPGGDLIECGTGVVQEFLSRPGSTRPREAKSCQAIIQPSTDWDIIRTVRRFTDIAAYTVTTRSAHPYGATPSAMRYRIRLRSSKGIAVPAGNTFQLDWGVMMDHKYSARLNDGTAPAAIWRAWASAAPATLAVGHREARCSGRPSGRSIGLRLS
jgi:hypothetical protein